VGEEVEGNKRFVRVQLGLEVVELLSFDVEEKFCDFGVGGLLGNDVLGLQLASKNHSNGLFSSFSSQFTFSSFSSKFF
jgi:hypothetical protein